MFSNSLFLDFEFLQGINQAIRELSWILHEGRILNMPHDCQVLIKQLSLFLRHRATWLAHYENMNESCMAGVWAQEIRNFPNSNQVVFSESIQQSLDNMWNDIKETRGGRLE